MTDISPDVAEQNRRAAVRAILGRRQELEQNTQKTNKASREFAEALREASGEPVEMDDPEEPAAGYQAALERIHKESMDRIETSYDNFYDRFEPRVNAANAALDAYEKEVSSRGRGGGGGGGGYGGAPPLTGDPWLDASPILLQDELGVNPYVRDLTSTDYHRDPMYLMKQLSPNVMGRQAYDSLTRMTEMYPGVVGKLADLVTEYYDRGYNYNITHNAIMDTAISRGVERHVAHRLVTAVMKPFINDWNRYGQGPSVAGMKSPGPERFGGWQLQAFEHDRGQAALAAAAAY